MEFTLNLEKMLDLVESCYDGKGNVCFRKMDIIPFLEQANIKYEKMYHENCYYRVKVSLSDKNLEKHSGGWMLDAWTMDKIESQKYDTPRFALFGNDDFAYYSPKLQSDLEGLPETTRGRMVKEYIMSKGDYPFPPSKGEALQALDKLHEFIATLRPNGYFGRYPHDQFKRELGESQNHLEYLARLRFWINDLNQQKFTDSQGS